MSDPTQGPWEQLTEDQQRTIRNNFEYTVDEVIRDVSDYYLLDTEHAEALFADWVTSNWRP